MHDRIGFRPPSRIYLAEWREHFGFTQKELAEKVSVKDMTVSRWERTTRKLNTVKLDKLANALGIEPVDFYRSPDVPSVDAMLRNLPESVRRQAIAIIETLSKTN